VNPAVSPASGGKYTVQASLVGYAPGSEPGVDAATDPDILIELYAEGQDSDGDGLTDSDEVNVYLTDPLLRDSDGDGFGDGVEVGAGTDPNSTSGPYPPADGDLAPLGIYDGEVNAGDVLMAARMASGELTQTVLDIAHGDLNPIGTSAGVIDASDLLLIKELVFGAP